MVNIWDYFYFCKTFLSIFSEILEYAEKIGIDIKSLPKDLAVDEILELNVRRLTLPLILMP